MPSLMPYDYREPPRDFIKNPDRRDAIIRLVLIGLILALIAVGVEKLVAPKVEAMEAVDGQTSAVDRKFCEQAQKDHKTIGEPAKTQLKEFCPGYF